MSLPKFATRSLLHSVLFWALVVATPIEAQSDFVRGDINADASVDIGDAIGVLGFLFGGSAAPDCQDSADGNDDGLINIGDAIALLSHLFSGSGPLPEPSGACGPDPTADTLTCETYAPCAVAAPGFVPEPPRNGRLGISSNDSPHLRVLLCSGEVTLMRNDLSVMGRNAGGFTMTRTYRSGDFDAPLSASPLGPGWDSPIFRRLELLPGGIVRRHPGNGRHDDFNSSGVGSYSSPVGVYSQLRETLTGFQERLPNGTIIHYSTSGQITQSIDRLGNSQEFNYNASGQMIEVIEELGREILFEYDGAGRLSTITDFSGRQITYQYDADGNLIEVRTPLVTGTVTGNDFPQGVRERYNYQDSATTAVEPRLDGIVFPTEVEDGSLTEAVSITYGSAGDPVDGGRITILTVGGVNSNGIAAGGAVSYQYNLSPTAGPPEAASLTTVTDRIGNVTSYYYSPSGHLLERVEDPQGEEIRTSFQYSGEGELIRRVAPMGNETLYTFDDSHPSRFSQGNLLKVTQLADPVRGGDGYGSPIEPLKTSVTYEPLFNRPLTSTDPLGNDAFYLPQNGGNQSAARYTTRFFFDWQESGAIPDEALEWDIFIDPSLVGLGDLNGDGTTDQAQGQTVQIVAPTVTLLPGSNQAIIEGDTNQERSTRLQYNDHGQRTRIIDAAGRVMEYSYFPANDPDGDGQEITPGQDAITGGFLAQTVVDPAGLAITSSITRDPRGNVISATDPNGNTRTYTYNLLNWHIRSEAPRIDPSQDHGYYRDTIYDANGNVIESAIENWTMVAGVPQQVAAPFDWFRHTLELDILGDIRIRTMDARRDPAIPSSQEPEMLVTSLTLDANQQVIEEVTPLANAAPAGDPNQFNRRSWTRDSRGLVVVETEGSGSPEAALRNFVYDLNGAYFKDIDQVDNNGDGSPEAHTVIRDGFGRIIRSIDRAGTETVLIRDPRSRVIRREIHGPADGSGNPVLLQASDTLYDEAGQIFQRDVDLFIPGGFPTPCVTLDEGSLTPGDGKITTRFEYNAAGIATFQVEDDGDVYQWIHDAAGRLIESRLPLEAPGGEASRTQTCYDANGNAVRIIRHHTDPTSAAATRIEIQGSAYDSTNRLTHRTDSMFQTRYFDYNSRDQLIASYDPVAAATVNLDYQDCAGSPETIVTNVRGNGVYTVHDGAGRPWLTRRQMHVGGLGDAPIDTPPLIPDGFIDTVTVWDANSRPVLRIDGTDQATAIEYGLFGGPSRRVLANGATTTWTYDLDHHLVAKVDANGSQHSYQVDPLGRTLAHTIVTATDTIPGTNPPLPMLVGTTEQTFDYDGLGRITRCVDNNEPSDPGDDWQVDLRYDSLGRQIHEVQKGLEVCSSYTSESRTSLTYPDGRVINFEHDAHDQLLSISDDRFCYQRKLLGSWSSQPVESRYSAVADPAVGCSEVLLETRVIDLNQSPISSSVVNSGGTDVGGYTVLERRGNRQVSGFQQRYGPDSAPSPLLRTFDLDLDSAGRMNQEFLADDALATSVSLSRDFDAAQALRSFTQLIDGPGGQQSFSADITRDSVHQQVDPEIQYDAGIGNGNRTSDFERHFQWDGLNRLRSVIDRATGEVIARYNYDAHPAIFGGRRVEKDVTFAPQNPSLVGETRYYYDGADVIEEQEVINEVPQLSRQFIGGNSADEWVAMDVDTSGDGIPDQLYFYLRDFNHNITHLIDADTGEAVELYFYATNSPPKILDPLTLVDRGESLYGNPFLRAGRRGEPEIRLYYYRARYLEPVDGEFLSRDPLGMWGDAAHLGNGLAYAGNNPWNHRDPSGLALGHFIWNWNVRGLVLATNFMYGLYAGDGDSASFVSGAFSSASASAASSVSAQNEAAGDEEASLGVDGGSVLRPSYSSQMMAEQWYRDMEMLRGDGENIAEAERLGSEEDIERAAALTVGTGRQNGPAASHLDGTAHRWNLNPWIGDDGGLQTMPPGVGKKNVNSANMPGVNPTETASDTSTLAVPSAHGPAAPPTQLDPRAHGTIPPHLDGTAQRWWNLNPWIGDGWGAKLWERYLWSAAADVQISWGITSDYASPIPSSKQSGPPAPPRSVPPSSIRAD